MKYTIKEKYLKFKEINLYLFGLSFFSNFDLAKVFLGIMIGCLVIDIFYYKEKLECGNNKLRNFLIFLILGGTIWNFCADFNYKAARAYLKINRYVIIVFYLYSLVKNNKMILRNFIISLTISYLTLIIRGINFYFIENKRERFGNFEGIMDVAVLVAVIGAFCFGNIIKFKELKYKLLNGIILFFTIFLLIITQTRAALLAFIVGIIGILIFNKNIKLILASCLLGSILVFCFLQTPYSTRFKSNTFNTKVTLSNMSNGLRVEMWKNAIWRFKQHPIMGSGTKQDEKLYREYVNNMPEETEIQIIYKQRFKIGYDDAHSMYFNSLTDNGLLLIAQLIFIFGILPYILSKNSEYLYSSGIMGGLISYCVFGIVWPLWRSGWDPMLVWLLVSLTCCSYFWEKNNNI